MDNTTIDIIPCEFVKTEIIHHISISVIRLELFKSVTINVTFLNENNKIIKGENLTLAGDDYAGWSADDQYIYNYVLYK